VLLLAFIGIQQWRIRMMYRVESARQRESESLAKYSNLFNAMPIVYIQMKVIYDENGNQITVAHIHEGQIFGAELACSGGVTSPVCLRTASVCTVMLLNFGVLLSESSMGCPCRMQVTANLMQEFARQVLAFNTKVRILGQKRLRDRLKIYLQTLTPNADGVYTLPYSRAALADFLCVDRSALSRELCRMRDEGILSFSGSKICMLDSEFLHA